MTHKLFDNGDLSAFECTVTSVTELSDRIEIITDSSAFFPEGGGQTCDKGTLGGMPLSHVRLDADDVVHIINVSDYTVSLKHGDTVTGIVDMTKRQSDMQQHSGEHVVSGLAHSIFGCDNVGFRLGNDTVTLDLNIQLNTEQLDELERKANTIVRECRQIKIEYPDKESLATIDYRSKKEVSGATRLVFIDGVDICACCAPHVSNTGKIGLIRFVAHENYKGGTRLHILCGSRAIDDIMLKLKQNSEVSSLLSVKENATAAAVQRILDEKSALAFSLRESEKRLIHEKVKSVAPSEYLIVFEDTNDVSILREMAVELKNKSNSFSAVFGLCNGRAVKYVICCPHGDAREIGKQINTAFNGRGGGKPDMVQGTLDAKPETLRLFLEQI